MNIKSSYTTNVHDYKMKFNNFSKRLLDIVVSIIAIIILAPIFGLIAIAIKRDTPGPVFYHGTRVGRGGKNFRILKFRTMYEDPKSYSGPKVTAKGDPRITTTGKWLRDSKLNELPQFWNVLKGEMSLVGPRPEDPSLEKTWPAVFRKDILSVKPGITSPATVVYHNEEVMLTSQNFLQQYINEIGPDKMRLDQMYVHHQSFMLDLDVLLWTALILLPMIKSTTPPETLLFVGPITRFTRRHLSWLTIDLLITSMAITLTGITWRSFTPLDAGLFQAISMAIVFSTIFSVTGAIMGVNKIQWQKAPISNIYNMLPAWLVASVIAIYLNWSFQVLPLGLIAIASAASLGGFIFIRYFRRFVTNLFYGALSFTGKAKLPRERVLIIGSGRTAEQTAKLLRHPSNSSKFQLIGFADNDLFSQGMNIYGRKILGTIREIPMILEKYDIQLVLFASHQIDLNESERISKHCKQKSIKIVVIPDLFGSLNTFFENRNQETQSLDGDQRAFTCKHCLVNGSEPFNNGRILTITENTNQAETFDG